MRVVLRFLIPTEVTAISFDGSEYHVLATEVVFETKIGKLPDPGFFMNSVHTSEDIH
jgi:hypothetical protein